jgi:hypothetical protein
VAMDMVTHGFNERIRKGVALLGQKQQMVAG